jgi:hypothetical protein
MAFHLLDLMDLSGTSLSRALASTPGLAVPYDRRRSFVRTALESIARMGEPATMREVAADYAASHPLPEIR